MASFARLTDIAPEKTQFLWAGRIPYGAISILEGDPGDGKSSVMMDLAAKLTSGQPMPFSLEPLELRGAVLIGAEDHVAARVQPAMKAAGADLDRVAVLEKSSGFLLPGNISDLETAVADVDAGLVVIDPIASFLAGSLNNDQSVRNALGPLVTLAERKNLAVVIIRHLTKNGGNRSLTRGAGSIGIVGLARSCLTVNSPPAAEEQFEHRIALTKSNLSDAPLALYRTTKTNSGVIGVTWLREEKQTSFASDLIEAGYTLYCFLLDGPMAVTKVFQLGREQAGISARVLKQARKNFHIRSRRIGSGKQSYWIWELPRDRKHLAGFQKLAISDVCEQLINGGEQPSEVSPPEFLFGEDEAGDEEE